ncbi:unnamed protein product [Clonostachys solani]|uniref:Urease accessory protein UreD n=1 Tax=Clonostachys solani TaxID=160281 RepID=A0A9P0ELY6_9HYPO|nr:unnamed protein product [Clonostachys solani]
MPHKHKRKRGDDGDYELPPTQKARALPVKGQPSSTEAAKRKNKKRNKNQDDAPRAFRRLMAVAQGKKFRSGLDNGDKKEPSTQEPEAEPLRIRPGEDMRTFASRVDAALPVSGLTKKAIVKDGRDEQGMKVYKTRKEKKMHKLYDQWRAEERKIHEKREDELELEAEKELENDGVNLNTTSSYILDEPSGGKKKKRGGKDDPWAVLRKRRGEGKIGLHDTAQAPPELHKQKTRMLKVTDGATVDVGSIPKSAGSLRRREELQVARDEIVGKYRKLRAQKHARAMGKSSSD